MGYGIMRMMREYNNVPEMPWIVTWKWSLKIPLRPTPYNFHKKRKKNLLRKRRSLTRSVLGRLVDFCLLIVWFPPMDVRSSTIRIHSSRNPHLFRFCKTSNCLFSAHSTCTLPPLCRISVFLGAFRCSVRGGADRFLNWILAESEVLCFLSARV